MKQLSLIGLTLIFLLLFNYASASIINTAFSENNSNEEIGFQIGSRELDDDSKNLGMIVIDGKPYKLPYDGKIEELKIGEAYVIGYIPEEGYVFDHWEIKGGELRSSEKQQTNVLRIIDNNGMIIAVYRKRVEITTIVISTEGEASEEYELPLGKVLSLSIHEVIEEHKESISYWIFEHKFNTSQKYADKINAITDYQNELKQKLLVIKEKMKESEEELNNGVISEEEFVVQMEILRSKISEIINSNEKLGHILGSISKDFSDDLRRMVEERKKIHDEFKEELNGVKEEVKTQIMKTKTKILKTTKTTYAETTKTPPGQTKKNETTKTKKDKGKD